MKLKKHGPNMTEIELAGGVTVLYSYETPVAAHVPGEGYMKSSKFFSRTTSKHVGQWLQGWAYKTVDQETIESIAGGQR